MVIHMKTTLNIDDAVMKRLKEEAARTGRGRPPSLMWGRIPVLTKPTDSSSGARRSG